MARALYGSKKHSKNYNLRSHFESGIGVGIQGTLENEKVTLLRIGGKRMEKYGSPKVRSFSPEILNICAELKWK